MAFYADQMFYARTIDPPPALTTASITGTGTAVTGALAPVSAFHPFFRNTAVNKAQLYITTSNAGNPIWNLYNGTNIFATLNLGTGTVGQIITATINTANNTFTAGGSPTGTATGTATSAGIGAGIGQLWFELQETYSSSD